MSAEKLHLMSYVIYLSLCLGAFLKFKNCGVKGWPLLFSLVTPILGVCIALVAPIKFLRGKEKYTFPRKMILFPFFVLLTIKVFPMIVGCVADRLKEVHEKHRAIKQELNVSNFGAIFLPEMEKYYIKATEIRFGV